MSTAACVMALLMASSPMAPDTAAVAAPVQEVPSSADTGSAATAPSAPVVQVPSPEAVPPVVDPASAVPIQNWPKVADAPSPQDDGGTITVTARGRPPKEDPVQAVNVVSFQAVQAVDKAVIGPIAHGYEKGIPRPVRKGLHNLLNNLDEPIVFVNFLLQLKPGKAVETLGRFTINSTLGIAGLIDMAKRKPFHLPRRSNGLADTLGYYGVGPGPYLFLPLIGSTTIRDMFGRIIDLSLVPTLVGRPFNDPTFALAKGALSSLDERAEFDADLKKLRTSPDPYSAQRAYYLQRRQAEIDVLRGKRDNADIDVDQIVNPPAAPQGSPVPAVPAPDAPSPGTN